MNAGRHHVRVFLICVGAVVAAYAVLVVNVYRHEDPQEIGSANAIVVLGAAQWNGKPSPMFQARLDRAYVLYQNGVAPFIFITGGIGEGATFSDSYIGKEYLVNTGIDEHVILIEEQSRTTWQNLRQVKKILSDKKFDSIVLVSHDFHIMRAVKMAQDLGMETHAAPVRTNNALSKFGFAAREAGLYVLYLIFKI